MILKTVGQVSTKFLFGKKHSRNPEFISAAAAYANGVIFQAMAVRILIPTFLYSFVRSFVLPYTPLAGKVRKIRALIEEDVYNCLDRNEDAAESTQADGHVDFTLLPFMVEYVQQSPEYVGASRQKILAGVVGRSLGLLFAATDTTTITFTNIIFDLVSQPKKECADVILEEATRTLQKYGGQWTKQALSELVHLDSLIKESQRLHPIALSLAGRKVMAEGGYTFGIENGEPIHVRQGSTVGNPLGPIHFDPEIYPDPHTFRAFRFVDDAIPSSQPSDIFMSFGHGEFLLLLVSVVHDTSMHTL